MKAFRVNQLQIASLILLLLVNNKIKTQTLFINEFMASNITAVPEIVDYDDYSDWIELYNNSTDDLDLSGYYITDNLEDPTKWRIPDGTLIDGKGFLIFWADGNNDSPQNGAKYFHMPFSLSKTGEEIGLFSPEEILLDSITFNSQITDVSFGRKPDGGSDWFYFGEPTHASSNNTQGVLDTTISDLPEVSLNSGFYSGSQSVVINSSATEAIITYTLDGSRPQSTSLQYSSPIEITSNTTMKVRVFDDQKLPSKIITKTYFIDQDQNLPVLSLSVFPETFFDNEIGIYTNEIKSREVPINVHYFEKGGALAFEIDAGTRLSGQASFTFPQKSITVEADDKYGISSINYKIFENRNLVNYNSIYLRNSGYYDNQHTMFRDALQHTLVINQMDIDCIAYQPAATFINGEYWGIYNIREKFDKNYLASHHGVDPNNIDYLEYEFNPDPIVIEGDTDDYFALQKYLAQNSMNIKENWDYVQSKIDVNEVMNYLITELYCDNVNWPNTNSRWWKEKTDQGKWRYVFLDSDYGFGAPSWFSHYSNNALEFLYSQEPFSTFVFRKLLENKDFKNEFIQRFATFLNTTFHKERVVGIVDSLQNQIKNEMVNHINRWKNNSPSIPSVSAWNAEVEIMREFADKRPEYMKQSIIDFYNLSGSEIVRFNLSEQNSGKIKVTGIDIKDGLIGEYFRNIPIKIEAIPEVGFRFIKWIGVEDSLSKKTFLTLTDSELNKEIIAVFEEDNVSILPSIISENTILNSSGSPYFAKGDVVINSGINLTFEAGVEILMPNNAKLIVNGNLKMMGTSEQPIIIKPNENSGYNNWGIIYLENTTDENVFNHVELIAATRGENLPNQQGAISSFNADLIIENVSILDAPFPVFIQYGNAVIRNSTFHSEVTCDLINIKYAESALVENCDFRGNNAFDTDAIDYDQISNGTIRANRIYNFYGFNSDGIDLGEGSQNIIIENNLILNCADKGISVGQGSTTIIKNNIIVNCAQGVGIKDDLSYALIDRNTFFGCDLGVASFEKNIGAGGGNGEIVNSIFSNSITEPIFVDNLSTLNVSYSLSDSKKLDGTENINADPFFTNNFILNSNSPAINSGSPITELDPDGTRADVGARYFNGKFESLIINEINYNPHNGEENEFIEFYNSGSQPINISGYKIKGAINFTFPNEVINPKELFLAAKSTSPFEDLNTKVFLWGDQIMPNNWGNIILYNNLDEEIDFVSYSNKFNWPSAADGNGHTLELINPLEENLITEHWKASNAVEGSPGSTNKIEIQNQIFINEFQADNKSVIKDEFNEYDDWIEIYNGSNIKFDLSNIYITDDYSNLTKYQISASNEGSSIINPKEHFLLWADGSPDQGINHLNFKLSASGEQIALVYIFENDTTIIDSISFGDQKTDFSYGRSNDGEDNWHVIKAPTPGKKNSMTNLFENGTLLVNGLRFSIDDVNSLYENKAVWGNNNISFWDLYTEPFNGYPSTLPEPVGNGEIPFDTLINYSTIIWTGENIDSEISLWNNTNILEYVKMGGNLLLLLKNGRDYLKGEMLERMGIVWSEPENAVLHNCISVFDGLDSIVVNQTQYLSSVFETTFTIENSKLLFVETSNDEPSGIGMWNKPPYGGWYKDVGGQIAFLSGRAYRYNNTDLRKNVEFILSDFFEEPVLISVDDDHVFNDYKLSQNYPNPFNPSTTIKYTIPTPPQPSPYQGEGVWEEIVSLVVYDILGREITTLVNENQKPGNYQIEWNAENISSGIYFYRIQSSSFIDVKKMILLR